MRKRFLTEVTQDQYERELKSYIATSLMAGCTYEEVPQSLVEDYRTSLQTECEDAAAAAGIRMGGVCGRHLSGGSG